MNDWFQIVRRDGPAAISKVQSIPDLNVRNDAEENLLHVAIAYSNIDCAIALVRMGIDVNAQNAMGMSPLHYAACYQHPAIAKVILEHGGQIGIIDEHGNTALWTAVFNAKGNYETVKVLVDQHARQFSDLKNKYGRSPLDFAKQIGDAYLVDLILGQA